MYKNYLNFCGFENTELSERPMKLKERDRTQLKRWMKNDDTISLKKMRVLFQSFSN